MKNLLLMVLTAMAMALATSIAPAQETASPPAPPQESESGDMGMILIRGLKQTEGCLGVKTCQWSDGKNSIVAWFQNKQAAVDWYNSPIHQAMIGGKTDSDLAGNIPLRHVTDEDAPIMVIASLTPANKPELPGVAIPISQISIELFAPLPGGAYLGGRVSPETFVVPHIQGYTDPPASDTKPDDR